ncbi:MAG: hypothetical protein SGPRY_005254 [Prymnesium sp.]
MTITIIFTPWLIKGYPSWGSRDKLAAQIVSAVRSCLPSYCTHHTSSLFPSSSPPKVRRPTPRDPELSSATQPEVSPQSPSLPSSPAGLRSPMRPLEEEEYDDSYFEKEMSRARSVKQEEEASEWHDSFMLSLQFFNIPQASRILPSSRLPRIPSPPAMLWLQKYYVKLMTHTAFYLAYILLFWILLTGSQLGVFATTAWPWMYREGTLEVCYLHLDPLVIEMLLWVFYIGRLIEECGQMQKQSLHAYFSSYWNKLDIVTLITMSSCFVLRLLQWLDFTDEPYGRSSGLRLTYDARKNVAELVQCLLACSSVIVVLRFLEMLSYVDSVGELVKPPLALQIFRVMVRESASVVVLLFCFTLAFGIGFTALVPSLASRQEYWRRPIFFGMWALYGEFEIEAIYDALGSDNWLNFTLVLLLWVYTLLTTIFLVNLMIAQMTKSYESIKAESFLYRRLERVNIVIEYKDFRGAEKAEDVSRMQFETLAGLLHRLQSKVDALAETIDRAYEKLWNDKKASTFAFGTYSLQMLLLKSLLMAALQKGRSAAGRLTAASSDDARPPSPLPLPLPTLEAVVHKAFDNFAAPGGAYMNGPRLRTALNALGIAIDDGQTQAYLHQFDVNPNSRLELDDFMHLVNNLRVREKSANSGPRSQARPLPATLACPGPTHPSSGSLQSLTHEQASLSAEQHHARVTAVAARVEAALKDEAKAELR